MPKEPAHGAYILATSHNVTRVNVRFVLSEYPINHFGSALLMASKSTKLKSSHIVSPPPTEIRISESSLLYISFISDAHFFGVLLFPIPSPANTFGPQTVVNPMFSNFSLALLKREAYGSVLAPNDGAIKPMLPPFFKNLGYLIHASYCNRIL